MTLRNDGVKPERTIVVPGMLGLRAVAALSIVAYHTWLYSSPGGPVALPEPFLGAFEYSRAGTGMFILLSGFLLYLPLTILILTGQPLQSARSFLRRRALRLFPAYWLVLLVVSLVLGVALIRVGGQITVGSLVDHPDLLLLNMLLLQNFWPTTFLTGIGPAWFISTVVVFYLCLPALAAFAALLAGRAQTFRAMVGATLVPAVALIILGLAAKVFAELTAPAGLTPGWDANWSSVIAHGFPGQADRFGYGMVAAVVWSAIKVRGQELPARWWTVPLAAGLATVAASIWAHRLAIIDDLGLESGLTLGLAMFLLIVALQIHLPRRARLALGLLDARVVTLLGLVSYSIFLWNEPLIRWLNAEGVTHAGPLGLAVNLALALVLVLTVSTASYFLAERRFVSSRRSTRPSGAAAPAQPV